MKKFELIYKIFKASRKTSVVLLTLFILSIIPVYSMIAESDSTEKVISNLRDQAIRYDRNKDIYNAIRYYSRYLSYKKDDIKLTYRLATLCFDTRDYNGAFRYFDTVTTVMPRKFPLAYYKKGIACMSLEKYDNAIESFAKFKKFYKSRKDKPGFRRLAAIYAANSDWARKNPAVDGKILITHQGPELNHSDIDFSPFPVDEKKLIYGALYSDATKQADPVRQIYKAGFEAGKWKNEGLLEGGVNDHSFNTGNAVISEDGKTMFFTRTRKNWQNKDISEIFVSTFSEGEWQEAEKLPFPINREDCTTTQPALGKNLKSGNYILYFVSDRPGGKGGLDIWFTEYDRKTKTYRKEMNLNNKINSPGDDCTPFYDITTQNLYFSSRGRKNSLGGFDIYKSTGSGNKWTDAVPLPRPLNSPYDDYYYSIQKNNRQGFFTSNRPGTMTIGEGTCCDDIFTFRITDCAGLYSRGTVRNDVNYEFYKTLNEKYDLKLVYPENNSPVPDVPVELNLLNENEEILISKTTTGKEGSYNFILDQDKHYKVVVKNYGYFEKTLDFTTEKSHCSDTIEIGTTKIKYLPAVSIRINVYYDFDKFKLSDVAKESVDRLIMPLFGYFPEGIIEIGSHTDSKGTEQYNLALSQKRSESIVSYIISKGIPAERLVAKGYGMSMPIAPNTNPDGTDNPEGRQLNRRTEFKIVGQVPSGTGNE